MQIKMSKYEMVKIRPLVWSTYANVTKQLRAKIDVDALSVSITRMKMSKNGEVVLLIEKDSKYRLSSEKMCTTASNMLRRVPVRLV